MYSLEPTSWPPDFKCLSHIQQAADQAEATTTSLPMDAFQP